VAEKVKEEGIPSDDFTAAHWRSIGKEMESDFHYTSIKKHYNFLISALLEKFSSLSISQRTLAVKKAIMCKSSSVARNWRSKSITLLVADPEGANISSQEMGKCSLRLIFSFACLKLTAFLSLLAFVNN